MTFHLNKYVDSEARKLRMAPQFKILNYFEIEIHNYPFKKGYGFNCQVWKKLIDPYPCHKIWWFSVDGIICLSSRTDQPEERTAILLYCNSRMNSPISEKDKTDGSWWLCFNGTLWRNHHYAKFSYLDRYF